MTANKGKQPAPSVILEPLLIYTVYHQFVAATRAKPAVILRHKSFFFCSSVALYRQPPSPSTYIVDIGFHGSSSLPLPLRFPSIKCCVVVILLLSLRSRNTGIFSFRWMSIKWFGLCHWHNFFFGFVMGVLDFDHSSVDLHF